MHILYKDHNYEEILQADIKEKYEKFKEIFKEFEGGIISTEERDRKNLNSSEFVYGEIEFLHFLPLLNMHKGKVFWDLGCGTGKALITASLSSCGFEKICGVEFLHGLWQCANKAINKWTNLYPSINDKYKFKIIEGDITKTDWSNADIIYVASLAFPDELMKIIAEQGKVLKKGTIIISIKKWEGEQYKTLAWLNVKMGWGKKGVYIQEKI